MIRFARCRSSSSSATRPGLDRLAQAHVVGEQQVDPRRLDRTGDRLQLVLLDDHTRTQRRLQGLHVRGGHRRPADRVEEGGQALGRVEAAAGDLGQRTCRQDFGGLARPPR